MATDNIFLTEFNKIQIKTLFLLSEHILCKESIVILKKIDLGVCVSIRFEVSKNHLCYFRGDVCMYVCVYVSEHDSV